MEDLKMEFSPEIELTKEELSALASIYGQPGFKVLTKMFRSCVDWFAIKMINADPSDKEDVLAKHVQAKTAAQLYTLLLENINENVMQYIHSMPSDKPIEAATGLDLGDFAEAEEEPIV